MVNENCSTVGGQLNDVPTDTLKVRVKQLEYTPVTYADSAEYSANDPRCGCGTENGNTCFWDSLKTLTEELTKR